ncbi:hypothetical protein TWF694_002550 [Orbilia ellipsospora]|uniref:PPPDE domain-containing protein n=1 Tax=Orbilia ellipsospora TaxID=2528407 RepID=A0AAV9X3I8_9PEZI
MDSKTRTVFTVLTGRYGRSPDEQFDAYICAADWKKKPYGWNAHWSLFLRVATLAGTDEDTEYKHMGLKVDAYPDEARHRGETSVEIKPQYELVQKRGARRMFPLRKLRLTADELVRVGVEIGHDRPFDMAASNCQIFVAEVLQRIVDEGYWEQKYYNEFMQENGTVFTNAYIMALTAIIPIVEREFFPSWFRIHTLFGLTYTAERVTLAPPQQEGEEARLVEVRPHDKRRENQGSSSGQSSSGSRRPERQYQPDQSYLEFDERGKCYF